MINLVQRIWNKWGSFQFYVLVPDNIACQKK